MRKTPGERRKAREKTAKNQKNLREKSRGKVNKKIDDKKYKKIVDKAETTCYYIRVAAKDSNNAL